MMAITFDTLAYSKRLRSAGVSEEVADIQAEALADVIDDHLVKKKDIDDLEIRLDHRMEQLDTKIDKMGYRLSVRLGGMVTAAVVVLAAIVKF